jgi:vacuolar-type H+-ATPase subunit F/Vma7
MIVRVLTRPELAAGFELAGVPVMRVHDQAMATETIRAWAGDDEIGVILVDESLYRGLPHELMARLDRQALPIVAALPEPRWDERAEAETYVLEILRRAIGYRVRPR